MDVPTEDRKDEKVRLLHLAKWKERPMEACRNGEDLRKKLYMVG